MDLYSAVRSLAKYGIVKVFFRDVDIVGEYRVPGEGPVIFVANHANQFVDPIMLVTQVKRVIRFLSAAKSMRRPIIGHLARAFRAIGIERAQDLAKKGTGTVSAEAGSVLLSGEGTGFLKQLKPGYKVKAGGAELAVTSVESDVACTVAASPVAFAGQVYTIFPKVDQGDVYGEVHKALGSGDCIGIFPEGGSHDQTSMLELKPGVAIMALGAMNAGAGQVQIIPVGLTYFEPYRFRSRAVVEFGEPILCPLEAAEKYKTDKRGAVQDIMELVDSGMHAIKPDVRDYGELQALLTMRALYKPRDRKLTPEENLKLMRHLIAARKLLSEDENMNSLILQCTEYNEMLKMDGLKDRDVRLNLASSSSIGSQFVKAAAQVLALAPIALPAVAMSMPPAILNFHMAKKEKAKALAGSSVKKKALDVVASYKILVSMVFMPLYNLVLALIVMWFLSQSGLHWPWQFSTIYWLALPLVEYVNILACDAFFRAWTDVMATYNFLSAKDHKTLVQRRAELTAAIRSFAEKMGPQVMENFEQDRIIRRSEMDEDWSRMLEADPSLGTESSVLRNLRQRKPEGAQGDSASRE